MTGIKVRRRQTSETGGVKATVKLATLQSVNRPVAKAKNDLAEVRLAREWRTLVAMVRIFCRDKHQSSNGLCTECEQFLSYARVRLERCHFGPKKPICSKCPVHCYQRERRKQVRVIMHHAGPRMLWEHPVTSLRHWIDGWRTVQG